MNFENIKNAKNAYIEGHKIARKASIQGDFKTNNKVIKNQINPAFEYLKDQNELKILIELLEQDEDMDLKQAVAVALLPYYEDIAIDTLEDISNRKISNSFTAGIILKQWKNGLH